MFLLSVYIKYKNVNEHFPYDIYYVLFNIFNYSLINIILHFKIDIDGVNE